MLKLIPQVKNIRYFDGFLSKKAIVLESSIDDTRISRAVGLLPNDNDGAPLSIEMGAEGERYELWIEEDSLRIKGDGPAGVFYAIQTLRQILTHEQIPCLHIEDKPDFPYRGFYHDATRGKVPTVESIKKLIDEMAYFKLSSLQLYVEHTFEFEETKDLIHKTGYLSAVDIREIDAYCEENFIEFIPSLATFGHLFELLNQEKYKHLNVLKDYEASPNRWRDRMEHHTIDPMKEESFEVIKSLIDQYYPNFKTDYFNICCDETFDLVRVYRDTEHNPSRLYIDFVKKIISHLRSKGKTAMMWADILLAHPETISELPEDTVFLNWRYRPDPAEEQFSKLAELGRKQIVCPGTSIWNRFCERLSISEKNIIRVADLGYKHGALGVLNTNWGDFGHTCSMELSMYGMVLGAAKAWDISTETGSDLDSRVDFLLYQQEGAMAVLREVSDLNDKINYRNFVVNYFIKEMGSAEATSSVLEATLYDIQQSFIKLRDRLSTERWTKDRYREEMLLSAEAVCMVAELESIRQGEKVDRLTSTEDWLKKFRESWMKSNKESELSRIESFFRACEN